MKFTVERLRHRDKDELIAKFSGLCQCDIVIATDQLRVYRYGKDDGTGVIDSEFPWTNKEISL